MAQSRTRDRPRIPCLSGCRHNRQKRQLGVRGPTSLQLRPSRPRRRHHDKLHMYAGCRPLLTRAAKSRLARSRPAWLTRARWSGPVADLCLLFAYLFEHGGVRREARVADLAVEVDDEFEFADR